MEFRIRSPKSVWIIITVVVLLASVVKYSYARNLPRSDRAANPATRSVHDEAVRILESMKKTKYQHRTQIDEEKKEFYCDCSGFVGYVLNRTVGNDGTGALGDGRERPLAMHYEQFFTKSPTERNREARWLRIERLADARPGDIIAWRHEVPKPGNTGHVVIVDQRPVLEEDGLVRVVFIDSTSRPMFNDSRPKGTSGIGRATMWFKIDDQGRPVAHIRGARDAEPKAEAISIGRALPVKKSASRQAA